VSHRPRYYLGCPLWSNKDWVGRFFSRKAKPSAFLAQYASALSSVEGNTTFYAIPQITTVRKWREAVPQHFHFCFKFPRSISHEMGLRGAGPELARFMAALEPVHDRLGPFFLQLPPGFDDFNALERFLVGLPKAFRYAVEVRHTRFYMLDAFEEDFDRLLRDLQMDRVVFDTRNLMNLATDDPGLLNAKRKKPKNPARFQALARHPFLRYVGHPQLDPDQASLIDWARRVAAWIQEGRTPYVFMHQAPDDVRAPDLCRRFHETLTTLIPDLEPLPAAPRDGDEPEEEQLSLF